MTDKEKEDKPLTLLEAVQRLLWATADTSGMSYEEAREREDVQQQSWRDLAAAGGREAAPKPAVVKADKLLSSTAGLQITWGPHDDQSPPEWGMISNDLGEEVYFYALHDLYLCPKEPAQGDGNGG